MYEFVGFKALGAGQICKHHKLSEFFGELLILKKLRSGRILFKNNGTNGVTRSFLLPHLG